MMIATDVLYDEPKNQALAAGVVFTDWRSGKPRAEYTLPIEGIAPYEPGAFYKRELPCLLALLTAVTESIDIVVVDGFVDLGPGHPGLGRYLYEALEGKVAVVGVAKSRFRDVVAAEVRRGQSADPLYVTAAGIDTSSVVELVSQMHGPHRIPTLLKRVDALSRGRGSS